MRAVRPGMVSVRVSHHRQHGSGELAGPARNAGGFPAAPGESDSLAGASYLFDKSRDGQPAPVGWAVPAVASAVSCRLWCLPVFTVATGPGYW